MDEDDDEPLLPLQFALGILQGRLPSSNVAVDHPRSALDDIAARLLAFPCAKLKEANRFLQRAVGHLRRDFRNRDATDDLREAKEYALDTLRITSLAAADKFDVVKYVVVVEMLLFVNSFPACRSVQERIRCIQTTRRVCNVHLKKLNEIREMLLFLVEKLCQHEGVGKSETWLAEGLEMEEDEAPDPAVEAAKISFLVGVYVVNVQTQSFLDFVQSDFVAKSPGLVGEVVGPIKCESTLKVNVTTMKLDDVMKELFAVTKNVEIRALMGYPITAEDEEELEVEVGPTAPSKSRGAGQKIQDRVAPKARPSGQAGEAADSQPKPPAKIYPTIPNFF